MVEKTEKSPQHLHEGGNIANSQKKDLHVKIIKSPT